MSKVEKVWNHFQLKYTGVSPFFNYTILLCRQNDCFVYSEDEPSYPLTTTTAVTEMNTTPKTIATSPTSKDPSECHKI